jgi:hypothetical protein
MSPALNMATNLAQYYKNLGETDDRTSPVKADEAMKEAIRQSPSKLR